MTIKINSDKKKVEEIREKIKANDGFCPCSIKRTPETKCMCKEFIERQSSGKCHCGLYEKIND